MKNIFFVALFCLVATCTQAQTNPFAPTGKVADITAVACKYRAVLVKAPANLSYGDGYLAIIEDTDYRLVGSGPKTAGIFDVVINGDTMVVYEYHMGKPDTLYSLKIVNQQVPVAQNTTIESVRDPRRLEIYSSIRGVNVQSGVTYKGVAVDNTTGDRTYFTFEAVDASQDKLTPGIYEFLVDKDKFTVYTDLILNPKYHGTAVAGIYDMTLKSKCVSTPGHSSCNPVN